MEAVAEIGIVATFGRLFPAPQPANENRNIEIGKFFLTKKKEICLPL